MEIVPAVHHLPGVVANVFVLVDADGLTLVDTGLPYSQRRILSYLHRHGYPPTAVRRILITHADRDHMGSAAALKPLTGACVYASRLEGEAMAQGRETRRLRLAWWQKLVLKIVRPMFVKPRPVCADEFIEDGQTLPVLGGLRVLATPGHTPGHLSFFAPEHGLLFAGDSLRSSGGRVRVSSGPNTHDEAQAAASAWRQFELRPRVICTGHGPAVFLAP